MDAIALKTSNVPGYVNEVYEILTDEDAEEEDFEDMPLTLKAWLPDGYSQIFRSYVLGGLALRASGLWLCYTILQNLIPSFPWIAHHALHP